MKNKISDETLKQDIGNTLLEMNAYDKIRNGFAILSNLPENQGIQSRKYNAEYIKYDTLLKGCSELFNKLNKIKVERMI